MRFAIVCLLAGCAGHHHGGADGEATFRIFYPDAPADGFHAKVGKKLYLKPVGQCVYANGRDARWSMTGAKLESGELPPSFTLEDGAISGTPKAAGNWNVRIKFSGVTCAGTARLPQLIDVTITAK